MESLIGQATAKAAPAGGSDLVRDGTLQSFGQDVIEASSQVPVIVDFWATWCAPCRQLGPALEKAVIEAKGKVRLVKVDVDRYPEIAQQFRVQSLPAVYAVRDGAPIDGFVGALPEAQVKAFVSRLAELADGGGSGLDEVLASAAEALARGDFVAAEGIYGEILGVEPDHVVALMGLARVALDRADYGLVEDLLARVPEAAAGQAEVAAVRSALALAREADQVGDLQGLLDRLAADPDDHAARFDLALGLIGQNRRAEAVDQLLDIVKRARKWNDDAARLQLLKLFEACGFDDPVSIDGRRRLSTLLFA